MDNMSQMDDETFFESEAFKEFLSTLSNGMTKRFERPLEIKVVNAEGNVTAWTDNSVITVNISGPSLPKLSRSERFSALKGLVTHECGHVLFTDFPLSEKSQRALVNAGELLPEPKFTAEYNRFKQILASASAMTQEIIIKCYDIFDNAIEDGNIERQICGIYMGAAKDLRFVNNIYWSALKGIDKADPIAAIFAAVNQIAVYNEVKGTSKDQHITDTIEKLRPYVRAAVNEDNSEERKRLINDAYVLFINAGIDLLKQKAESQNNDQQSNSSNNSQKGSEARSVSSENTQQGKKDEKHSQQSQQSSSGVGAQKESDAGSDKQQREQPDQKQSQQSQESGQSENQSTHNNTSTGQNSDEEIARMLANSLVKNERKGKRGQNHALAPKGNTTAASIKHSDKKIEPGKKNDNGSDNEKAMHQILQDAAMEQAKNTFESNLESTLKTEGSECKQSLLSQYPMVLKRISGDSNLYLDSVVKNLDEEVKPYSKRIQRDIERILNDMQQGEVKKGLYMGTKFDSKSAYRLDARRMMNRKAPSDIPDLAIMVLVDTSGSMQGRGILGAQKTAYMVYDFCIGMNIPVSIYGHTEEMGSNVYMDSYAEFDSVDGRDRYRIAKMGASYCNRDGYAIRFASQHLAKRPEKMKILMIISDGKPNGKGYHGEAAALDVRKAVEEAKKQGITEVITAGIGDRRDEIREVYYDPIRPNKSARFLDISDLSQMPKLFVNIIREAMDID